MPDPTIRSAGQGVALCDDAVVQIAREAAASSDPGHNLLCDAWRGSVRAGECDEDDPLVQGAILGARAIAEHYAKCAYSSGNEFFAESAKKPDPGPAGLSTAEKKAQAERCACRGTDDYCPCQNTPDRMTLKERGNV